MKNRVDIVSFPLVKGCFPNNLNQEDDMTELSPLMTVLTATFAWHGARITFVSQFLIALIRVRTVNFTEIATAFCGEAKPDSHYRRIQRFFKDFPVTRAQIAAAVVQWLPLGQQWILCLDRTNWKFGSMNINILVLAVAYKGVAIPLLWILLDKRGISNSLERIGLLKHFLIELGHERIQCLTADRELLAPTGSNFSNDSGFGFAFASNATPASRIPAGAVSWRRIAFFRMAELAKPGSSLNPDAYGA